MEDNRNQDGNGKETSYFSYGPFKSTSQDQSSKDASQEAPGEQAKGLDSVAITEPKPVKLFESKNYAETQPVTEWEYSHKKRKTSFRSIFSAFLAGAVVVGGLMFASDQMNLFTGDQGIFSASSVPANGNEIQGNVANNSNGAVKNTSLDLIRPNNIAEIASNASPAVVKIEAFAKGNSRTNQGGSFFNDPFFRQFFGDEPQAEQRNNGENNLEPFGMGTGFIFDKEGYIITNQHVIEGADEIRVTVQGFDEPFIAELLGESRDLDLAALKIKGDKDFSILNLGNSDSLNVGDWVVAIGNPYGFDHTVTVGVLSAKERPISIPDQQSTREYTHLLQTDASINPGNSGGPLLNLNGEVVGINTAISSQAQGIGFAIPTSTISTVLDSLKNNIEIPKEPSPFIGVGLQNLNTISEDWIKQLKLENAKGSIVVSIEPGSPAYQAEMRIYDVITKLDGKVYEDTNDLIAQIKAKKVGDKSEFTVIRNGKEVKISVTIGDKNN